MIFHHRASIWSISLLALHPLISSTSRSSYNNRNPAQSCGPVPGPQDAQRRVAIIVTNHDLTLAALGKKRKKTVRGVTFKSGLANVDRELSLLKMATDMAYAHYLSFFSIERTGAPAGSCQHQGPWSYCGHKYLRTLRSAFWPYGQKNIPVLKIVRSPWLEVTINANSPT